MIIGTAFPDVDQRHNQKYNAKTFTTIKRMAARLPMHRPQNQQ